MQECLVCCDGHLVSWRDDESLWPNGLVSPWKRRPRNAWHCAIQFWKPYAATNCSTPQLIPEAAVQLRIWGPTMRLSVQPNPMADELVNLWAVLVVVEVPKSIETRISVVR